jgi:hypothetical protein
MGRVRIRQSWEDIVTSSRPGLNLLGVERISGISEAQFASSGLQPRATGDDGYTKALTKRDEFSKGYFETFSSKN